MNRSKMGQKMLLLLGSLQVGDKEQNSMSLGNIQDV